MKFVQMMEDDNSRFKELTDKIAELKGEMNSNRGSGAGAGEQHNLIKSDYIYYKNELKNLKEKMKLKAKTTK